ncbi:MAG: Gfo/Idh/MocA family oxidoreductase [Cyanobacteria bacterium P01_D01_bin.156]
MEPATGQINLALMGVGRWGTHLLRNFLAHPQIQVKAVVDPRPEQRAAIAAKFGLNESVALLDHWQDALEIDGLTAIAVATPATTHQEIVTAALQKQLHVLCEKPLTLTAKTSAELCKLAQQQHRQLFIDHTYLFHPAVREGHKHLPQLGSPRYGYAARTNLGPIRYDVNALWDLAIHDIAIFNDWLDSTPIRVQAHGLQWLQRSQSSLADMVWCRLQYATGFEATIHVSWANTHKQRQVVTVCDRGSLIFDEMCPDSPLTLKLGHPNPETFQPQNLETLPLAVPDQEPLATMCQCFVDSVLKNCPSPISSGMMGTQLVAILEALSSSLAQGGIWLDV